MDNVIQFQSRKQKTEKTRQEIYEEMAREGEALDNIQIIDVGRKNPDCTKKPTKQSFRCS